MRAALLAVVAAGALVAPPSGAAPCRHLVVDARGDVQWVTAGPVTTPPEDPGAVDLVSADLRTDARALTAVVRVAGVHAETGAQRLDHNWVLAFSTSAGERWYVGAQETRSAGSRFSLSRLTHGADDGSSPVSVAEGTEAGITGSVDVARGVVRVRVPVALFAGHGGLGAHLTRVVVSAASGMAAYVPAAADGGFATYGQADHATTSSSYRVGAPACA